MKIRFLSRRWIAIFLHVAIWALFIFYPFIIRHSFGNPNAGGPAIGHGEVHNFVNALMWIGLFYVNALFLMPRYFNKRKYREYAVIIVVILAILSLINWITFQLFLPEMEFRIFGFLMFFLVPTDFILLWSIAYRILLDRIREDRTKVEARNENLTTELSFLRSQVSPHFMFNVMNNMVALARKKSDLLEPSLIKLSALLRYMLYETGEAKVPLHREIEYLQSYIDLQRQRFTKDALINVSLDNVQGEYQIHPMLIIPFVENAFKHGTGMFEPRIDIEVKTEGSKLLLTVSNRYSGEPEEKDRSSGIGLSNVSRRLNLLYGNNHKLNIVKEKNRFTVNLEILLV